MVWVQKEASQCETQDTHFDSDETTHDADRLAGTAHNMAVAPPPPLLVPSFLTAFNTATCEHKHMKSILCRVQLRVMQASTVELNHNAAGSLCRRKQDQLFAELTWALKALISRKEHLKNA